MQNLYPRIRRALLKNFIPEFYWPKSVDLDGVTVPVRGMPLNFGTKFWLKNGEYEQDERVLLAKVLKPGMKVLEMGGSIGVLAQIVCQKVGSNGQVISIEASERLVEISSTMWSPVGHLKRVIGFAFPVENGDTIYVSEFQTEGSELDGRGTWELRDSGGGNAWGLRTIRSEFDFDPDVLIVDIEGGETILDVVDPDFSESIQSIIMEFHPHIYGIKGKESLENKIVKSGFQVHSRAGHCTLFVRV